LNYDYKTKEIVLLQNYLVGATVGVPGIVGLCLL
jgi:hypothetical protein